MSAELLEKERSTDSLVETLSQARIFHFFSPLALSWIFMSVEGPLSVALISRLPNAEVTTAGFQVMIGLALWIESPIIDLLSTSTTLAKTRQNYIEISRFVWWLIATVTVVHALLAFTPLYGFVTHTLMGVPTKVADVSRLGLQVMLPWSGLIGWRRYLQGILIRNGKTKLVGTGTAVRVVTMFVSALLLYYFAPLPGAVIAGIALVCAVAAESIFAHRATRDTVKKQFGEESPGDIVTMEKLRRFHLPLTATTMVSMLGTPVVSAALAHTPNSIVQLAGFQVASTLVWLMRTTIYALPEVVITLYRNEESAKALRTFCIRVGVATSGIMAVIWLTGLDNLYFDKVLHATPSEMAIAHVAFIAPILVPFIGACQSYVRGMLTAHHVTVSRLFAVGVSMTTLATTLALAAAFHVEGVIAAGLCLTLALLAELAVLLLSWRQVRKG